MFVNMKNVNAMIKIKTETKEISLKEEQFEIIKKLLRKALDFEIESYSIIKEMAIINNNEGYMEAINEMIEDEEEKKLLLIINSDEELVKKINEVINVTYFTN